uniref:Uncharacterized protein n=1 Tax=Haptolina brevifila TaxID=156173 RepID=A0A7S2INV8_9EUKA|mmetsp:Transcript_6917/g.14212  ORF Transcript_6917/g.14212 Transcript_6917/m.14212 type:complete len:120 (+) Transcript_6917:83-442(+)
MHRPHTLSTMFSPNALYARIHMHGLTSHFCATPWCPYTPCCTHVFYSPDLAFKRHVTLGKLITDCNTKAQIQWHMCNDTTPSPASACSRGKFLTEADSAQRQIAQAFQMSEEAQEDDGG